MVFVGLNELSHVNTENSLTWPIGAHQSHVFSQELPLHVHDVRCTYWLCRTRCHAPLCLSGDDHGSASCYPGSDVIERDPAGWPPTPLLSPACCLQGSHAVHTSSLSITASFAARGSTTLPSFVWALGLFPKICLFILFPLRHCAELLLRFLQIPVSCSPPPGLSSCGTAHLYGSCALTSASKQGWFSFPDWLVGILYYGYKSSVLPFHVLNVGRWIHILNFHEVQFNLFLLLF